MTNREWLESLDNRQLAEFLTCGLLVKNTHYEGDPFYINIRELSQSNISWYGGVYKWLSEEQEYEVAEENERRT